MSAISMEDTSLAFVETDLLKVFSYWQKRFLFKWSKVVKNVKEILVLAPD